MNLQEELLNKLKEDETEIIRIRRHLHEYPEISFHEKETATYIKKYYQQLGCPIHDCGDGYGFYIDIDSNTAGPHLALRADFDALAVQENNNLSFKSKHPGVMHACGHDGHTAYLMVLAKNLWQIKDKLRGKIRIIHQPAEEISPGGAISMLKDGVLDGIDQIIGLHLMSSMPTSMIGIHKGETQTGRASFEIKLTGKGGHASMPHLSNDAIVAGAYLVTMLQTIVSRRINPFDTASVTIGSFEGVGSFNAIKENVTLKGDVRIMKESTRKLVKSQIFQLVNGLQTSFNIKASINYDDNYPVLINNELLANEAITALTKAKLPEVSTVMDPGPQDPSEDFSYFSQNIPGLFFYVGCMAADQTNHPHHSPDFYVNENSLLIAAKAAAIITLHTLFK